MSVYVYGVGESKVSVDSSGLTERTDSALPNKYNW